MSENLDVLQGEPQEVDETVIDESEQKGDEAQADSIDEGESSDESSGGDEKQADDDKPAEPPKQKMGRAQKRIVNLVAENHRLQGELAAYRRTQQQGERSQSAEPKRDQFKSDDDYIAARVRSELARAKEEERTQNVSRTYAQRVIEARDRYEDWDEAFQSAARVDLLDDTLEAIYDSENGPDIAYYLATHPKDAIELSQLRPVQAARKIGLIEARIEAAKSGKQDPKPAGKPAPAPVKPVKAGGRVERDPSRMTDDEFSKWRREQIKKRGS